MKKVLSVLGSIFALIIIAFAGIGLYTWYKSSKYKETAVPYIEKVIPEISKWDPEIIKHYMVPNLFEQIKEEDFTRMIKYLSKLGKLEKINEINFANLSSGVTMENGKYIIVTYTVNTTYEKGDATVTITLLDLGNDFQIYRFNINSMALMTE